MHREEESAPRESAREEGGLTTSRVNLKDQLRERRAHMPQAVRPAVYFAPTGAADPVGAVLSAVRREHAGLLADDIVSDAWAADRLMAAVRRAAQRQADSPLEAERLTRRCEASLFMLGDLSEVLSDPDVMEVQMIGPDYATSRRKSRGLRRDPAVRFAEGTDPVRELQHFAQLYKAALDQTRPYATFIAGLWRVSIHIPPHVMAPFTLTMRRGADESSMLTEADFLRLGTLDRPTLDLLYALVDSYQTILTFAPQRSGKTWLQRLLIDHMDPEDGTILLLEDIPEIHPSVPCMNFYAVHRDDRPITMLTLSEWGLRESAVRVVLGEFRQKEAAAFIDLTQQGTSGLTTGHGGSCVEITNRLVDAYLGAMPSTTEAAAYRKIHQAVGFFVEMRRYVEPGTRRESFRVQGVYEVLPADGPVGPEHYRPIVRFRFDRFDPDTGAAVGEHEFVSRLTEGRYRDCLIRSSYSARLPEAVIPDGAVRVFVPGAGPSAGPEPGDEFVLQDKGEAQDAPAGPDEAPDGEPDPVRRL